MVKPIEIILVILAAVFIVALVRCGADDYSGNDINPHENHDYHG